MGNQNGTPMNRSTAGDSPSKRKMLKSALKSGLKLILRESDDSSPSAKLVFNPILAEHPLFQQKDDPFLFYFIEPLESALKLNPDFTALKSAPEKFRNFIRKLNEENKAVIEGFDAKSAFNLICEKKIAKGGTYFMCFDCNIGEGARICTSCFEGSNNCHQNHVVKAMIYNGEDGVEKCKCSCGDKDLVRLEGFCGKHRDGPRDLTTFIKQLQASGLEEYQILLEKAFYGCFGIYEMSIRTKSPKLRSELQGLAKGFLGELIDFCWKSYNNVNDPALLIIALALTSPLPDEYNRLWHSCSESGNLKEFEDGISVVKEACQPCKCVILAGVLRLIGGLSKDDQDKFTKVLRDCLRVNGFKDILGVEIFKEMRFLWNPMKSYCEILKLKDSIFDDKKGYVEIFNKGYFNELTGMMRELVELEGFPRDQEIRDQLKNLLGLIPFFLRPSTTSLKIVSQVEFRERLLEMLKTAQIKAPGVIGFVPMVCEQANDELIWTLGIYHLVLSYTKLVGKLNKTEKLMVSEAFMRRWREHYFSGAEKEDACVNLLMERAFCSLLMNYVGGEYYFNKEDIMKFFEDTEMPAEEIVIPVLRRILKGYSTLKSLQRSEDGKLLMETYYSLDNMIFDMDIVSIQLLVSVIKPAEVYRVLVEGYFSDDADMQRELLLNGGGLTGMIGGEKKLQSLTDFVKMILYIMKDETCLLNMGIRLFGEESGVGLESPYLRVAEKVVVEIFSEDDDGGINELKDKISKVLIEDPLIDEAINQVLVFNEDERRFKLKKEFQQEMRGFNKKEKRYRDEMRIGDESLYLKNPQKGFLESSSGLIRYLVKKLFTMILSESKKDNDEFVLVAFELMMLDLDRNREYYLSTEIEDLISILLRHNNSCLVYWNKIKLCEDDDVTGVTPTQDQNEKREEEEKIDDKLKCQSCEKNINLNDHYGIPIYVTITNNLYDENKPSVYNLEKETSMNKVAWWPVVSNSCGHHFHKDCFEKTKKIGDCSSLYGKYESFCPHPKCRKLSNAFMSLNVDGSQGGKDVSIDTISLPKRLQVMVMQVLRSWLAPAVFTEKLTIGEIFVKSYQYFIETFHMFDSVEELSKQVKLQIDFFKAFKCYFISSNQLGFCKQSFIVEAYEQLLNWKKDDPLNFTCLPEYTLNNYWAWMFIEAIDLPSELVVEKQVQLFKEYLSFRIIQLMASRKDQGVNSFEDCLSYYFENPELKDSIISFSMVSLKKIVLSCYLNFTVCNNVSEGTKDILRILCDKESSEELLLEVIGIKTNFEELIFEVLSSLPERGDSELPILNSILSTKNIQGSLEIKKLVPMAISLPYLYTQFNKDYAQKKCSTCDKFSLELCLCLTCGKVLCANQCGPNEMHLNLHARRFHRGQGAFLNIHDESSIYLACDSEITVVKESIYVNNLKQTLDVVQKRLMMKGGSRSSLDLKKFHLDAKTEKNIKNMITHNMIRNVGWKWIGNDKIEPEVIGILSWKG